MDFKKIIGIDTGVNTGIAIFDVEKQEFELIDSKQIHEAIMLVVAMGANKSEILVRVEDARQRKWIPKGTSRERLQGVGSVKRDAKIWEDFLDDFNFNFDMVAPKNNATKLTAQTFKELTGWKHRTNEHSRDASGLCFPFFKKKK